MTNTILPYSNHHLLNIFFGSLKRNQKDGRDNDDNGYYDDEKINEVNKGDYDHDEDDNDDDYYEK